MTDERDIAELIEALTAKHNDTWPLQIGFGDLINEDGPHAASEITRLRGEVERLTAEREGWGDIQGGDPNEARGLLSSAPKPGEG
jgi:hypothetical protein